MRPVINADWIDHFNHRVTAERVPVSGMIELTRRCNLKCVHCYLGEGDDRFGHGEMSTAQVCDVIDQITAAGCLYLSITGGDPMMRKDFPEVYRHAREAGLLVTVMCDGVLVTEKVVELFKELPPSAVEISLYGATAGTYETITRLPGSFPRCVRGIRRLVEAGVKVRIKTVLMTLNAHEAEEMRALAADFGLPLRMDAAIFPCLHTADKRPLDLRVPPQQVVQIELADAKAVRSWIEYLDRPAPEVPRDRLYVCGAGVTGFYIDPFGYIYPCMMTTRYRYNLLETDFATLWAERLGELHERQPRAGYECAGCDLQRACASCPGFHDQEHGAEDVKSDYVCDTAKSRWRALQDPQLRAAATAFEDGTA
jgi:radical SAM protein with 4Fe4S-binding SPASM domain